MTRAKDELHLLLPQRFFIHNQHAQGDRHVYASRTRFIPDPLLGLFEKTLWPPAGAASSARPVGQGPASTFAPERVECGVSRGWPIFAHLAL